MHKVLKIYIQIKRFFLFFLQIIIIQLVISKKTVFVETTENYEYLQKNIKIELKHIIKMLK